MRRLLLLLACLATALAAHARDFDWVIVEPMGETGNPAFVQSCLAIGPTGGPVRARLLHKDMSDGSRILGDCRVEAFAPAGAVLWSQDLTGKVNVSGLCVDTTGAIVLHGFYRDSLVVDASHQLISMSGQTREFLLKFDAARAVEWLFDAAYLPSLFSIAAMTIDAQDRVWVGGQDHVAGLSSAIHRLDADGAVEATYQQICVMGVSGLAVDADGTLWVVGPTDSAPASFNGYDASPPYVYNSYLAKYAPNGQAEWVHFVEDITFQMPRVVSDDEGGAYFAGDLSGAFAFGGLLAEGPNWVYDFFLTRVDAVGEFLWLREVPDEGVITGDAAHGGSAFLARGQDGGALLAGFSRFSVDWAGDGNPPPSFGGQDLLLLEYGPDGSFLGAKTAGGTGFDIADALAVDAAGTIYLAGQVGEGAEFDEQQFEGNFINAVIAALPAEPTAVDAAPAAALALANHPNPFNPTTRIAFRLPVAGRVSLEVFDLRGARLATLIAGDRAAGEQSVDWDGRDAAGRALASGIYLARLETAAGTASRRLVLLR
jgi:hypothetical protein